MAGEGATIMAGARPATEWRSEAGMPAAGRTGNGLAPLSEARCGLDELPALERFRRHPRRRDGTGKNITGPGISETGRRGWWDSPWAAVPRHMSHLACLQLGG